MNDSINRQAAMDTFCDIWCDDYGWRNCCQEKCFRLKWIKELPSAQPKRNGFVHIDDIYRLISGHSNYHGDNILAALTCLAEGKEVLKPITVL